MKEKVKHYQSASGVECIEISGLMGFHLGNVVKYLWRCESKNQGADFLKDLKKARHYLAMFQALEPETQQNLSVPGAQYYHVMCYEFVRAKPALPAYSVFVIEQVMDWYGGLDAKCLDAAAARLDWLIEYHSPGGSLIDIFIKFCKSI